MIQAYSKIIKGYVTQQYILNRYDKYDCFEQFFTPTDDIDRVNEDGDPVIIDTTIELIQEIELEQPKEKLDFDEWFIQNKHNDSVQRLYKGIIEQNPDYTLTFREWAKTFYEKNVNNS